MSRMQPLKVTDAPLPIEMAVRPKAPSYELVPLFVPERYVANPEPHVVAPLVGTFTVAAPEEPQEFVPSKAAT